MEVPAPPRTTVVESYLALEYQLTYNPTCGTPGHYEAAPFCTFHQVTQQLINNNCQTNSGSFQCNPAAPPYTGTCTTDSALVIGAHPLRINNFAPNFLSCLVPSCQTDTVYFTLVNQDSICNDMCGYSCARGHLYSITLVGYYVIGEMSAVGYPPPTQPTTVLTVCQGQTINFTAQGRYGVPPYHFLWSQDGGTTFDTDYTGTYSLLALDTSGYSVECFVFDTCNDQAPTNSYTINVLTSPPTNAGADRYVCEVEGGTVTIGGTPVTPVQDTLIGWSAQNATALSWLSDTTSPNPSVTVPPGTADTVFYVVSTTNGYCNNTDTVLVYSVPNPVVTIDSGGPTAFCPGQSVELIATATGGITSYAWSNGSVDSITTATTPGSYNVTVTSLGGCKDTSNSITVTNIGPPVFHIFPDTTIEVGDSVALFADINLLTATIDSFTWSPLVNLSCATCPGPFASPVLPQEYRLTVYRGGCFVSDSLLIQVILPTNFYIPNVFTPDRPGENDQFYIFCQSGVKVLSFQVFDRIGEKVHDGTYPWDGSYRGKPAPQGVYVYTFSLSLFGTQNSIFRRGSVTLLR
jgi:gliding motility-associated-like protein